MARADLVIALLVILILGATCCELDRPVEEPPRQLVPVKIHGGRNCSVYRNDGQEEPFIRCEEKTNGRHPDPL